jgi:hypothetical protein
VARPGLDAVLTPIALPYTYRFWLSSCLETYLRGSSMADQMFVIEQGLFDHLKGLILSPTKLSQTLQSMR